MRKPGATELCRGRLPANDTRRLAMLGGKDAMATIAVRDIEVAKRFYGQTLGLEATATEGAGVVVYRSGVARVVVYQSEFAGTNRATSATWGVGAQFDDIMRALKSAGVRFEHYDLGGLTREGDVHTAGSFKAAWFKDPDGNILHINNE
jgi:catechol 2,3-dioxygenase-like lactoylglutathione lyase family enzyme